MPVNEVVYTHSHWYERSKVHLEPELLFHHFVVHDIQQKHWLPIHWTCQSMIFSNTTPLLYLFTIKIKSLCCAGEAHALKLSLDPRTASVQMRKILHPFHPCAELCLTFHYPCFGHPSIHICSFLQFACHHSRSMRLPIMFQSIKEKRCQVCVLVNEPDQATRRFQRYTSFDWILEEGRVESIRCPQRITIDYGSMGLMGCLAWIVSSGPLLP